MSNKNIWYIENKNELQQIKNINKAVEEKFDYIAVTSTCGKPSIPNITKIE